MNARQIYKEINRITSDVIGTGLCDDSNFPALKPRPHKGEEIYISNQRDASRFLKHLKYRDYYRMITEERLFNIKFLDGALVSFHYHFVSGILESHRLSYLPSADLVEFQKYPDIYLEDEIYADVVTPDVVAFPIRFDYDSRAEVAKNMEHPVSHLTLGSYENCRIPVTAAVTPSQFMRFIMRNFYNTADKKYGNAIYCSDDFFDSVITDEERKMTYVSIGK